MSSTGTRGLVRLLATLGSIVLLAASHAARAAEGEFGMQVGALAPDKTITGDSGDVKPLFGVRGGLQAEHWGWILESWYSDLDAGQISIPTVAVRSAAERHFGPSEKKARWLISFGGGWMSFDPDTAPSVSRTFASAGLGQRIAIASQTYFRWELRGDHTLDDDGFDNEDITNVSAIAGITWGIGGRRDSDKDGAIDKKDDCPDTPRGARIDTRGCPIDSDGDGVPDGIDECPQTPQGWPVDARGCPLDSDGDGVEDGRDKCPDTPKGASVDENGCSKDSDGDGVPDGLDKCPDAPRGVKVDARGCPLDSDGDGVFDGLDKCPGTPKGAAVDATGCPPEPVPKTKPLVLNDVYFAFDSAELNDASRQALDRVVESLKARPDISIEVGGHTDDTGVESYNVFLSRERAMAVRTYLVSKGVNGYRLTIQGYGSSQPLAKNDTTENRAKNRRVELKRLD